jgi:hypothetical protein
VAAGAREALGAVADHERDEVAGVDLGRHVLDPPVLPWAEAHNVVLAAPAAITRDLLERYRADVFLLALSHGRKTGLLTDLKVFLDDVRLHEWADGLPANATYYRGEIPRDRSALPRFIDESVMGQLDDEKALDRLPDLTTRTAVVILIETGLRSVDCLRLPHDPITADEAGAPYLQFFNHKLSREAIIPISVARSRRPKRGGIELGGERDVLVVDVEDRPGTMGEIARRIGGTSVNIELLYTTFDAVRLVLGVDNLNKARAAL